MTKRYYFWTDSKQHDYMICEVNKKGETTSSVRETYSLYSLSLTLSNIIAEDPRRILKNKVPTNISDFKVDEKRGKIRLATLINPEELSILERFVGYHGGNKLIGREKIYPQEFSGARA